MRIGYALRTVRTERNEGDPITMTAADVMNVIRSAPQAKVIAVHMETVNHCWLKRAGLQRALELRNLLHHCHIPADGEWITA